MTKKFIKCKTVAEAKKYNPWGRYCMDASGGFRVFDTKEEAEKYILENLLPKEKMKNLFDEDLK